MQSTYADGDELAQQVSIRVIDCQDRFRGDAKWGTYLFVIACNLLKDEFRKDRSAKRRRDLAVSLDSRDWDSLPGASEREIEDNILLEECLEQLTEEERQIYEQYCWHGRSLQAIGTDLQYSATTIGIKLKDIVLRVEECRSS